MPGVVASFCDGCGKILEVRFLEGRALVICLPPVGDVLGLTKWRHQHEGVRMVKA